MNSFSGSQSCSQWKQRQSLKGNRRAQKHADVQTDASLRVPCVIAAPAASQLLIRKEDRTVRSPAACRLLRVGVGRIRDRRKMQLTRKDSARERDIQRCKVIHIYTGSAH